MTIHYHGTPITPRERLYELAGRHFCVSFAEPRDVAVCHQIGQSVLLDNGAYTTWRQGRAMDWYAWAEWVSPWLDHPTTWCVLPDSIEGGEEDNDRLLSYSWDVPGAPVWHLHESIDRLLRLADSYARVCFGSSGQYQEVGSDAWHRRVTEAFNELSGRHTRLPWIHMLRGMAQAGGPYPFASVDSANAARNSAGSWRQKPRPIAAMVAEADARQCPGRWHPAGTQDRLEGLCAESG